jgi:hypothetical protein
MLLQPASALTSAAALAHRTMQVVVLRPGCVTTPLSEHLPGLLRTGIPYSVELVYALWSLSGESKSSTRTAGRPSSRPANLK